MDADVTTWLIPTNSGDCDRPIRSCGPFEEIRGGHKVVTMETNLCHRHWHMIVTSSQSSNHLRVFVWCCLDTKRDFDCYGSLILVEAIPRDFCSIEVVERSLLRVKLGSSERSVDARDLMSDLKIVFQVYESKYSIDEASQIYKWIQKIACEERLICGCWKTFQDSKTSF